MDTAIYARVSTEEQARRNLSIPAQLAACREYAQRHGWDVPAEMELTDNESGAVLGRTSMDRLRELVCAGLVRRVIVLRQDRLARDELAYFTLRAEFKRAGVEVHAVNRGGKIEGLYASLEAVLDADERERIRARTDEGRRNKAKRGALIGHGPPPYGYIRTGEKDAIRWEPDPTCAHVVEQIFVWYVEALLSPAAIAARLTATQVPSPSDRRREVRRKRGPAQWNREMIRWILRNPTYSGTFYAYRQQQPRGDEPRKRPPVRLRPRSEWIPISVPALVDQTLWDAAQRRLDSAKALAFRNSKREYLIARRVRCGCGYAMTASVSSLSQRNSIQYPYYACNTHKRRGSTAADPCGTPYFRADLVDACVWAWVRALFDPETLQRYLAEREQRRRHRADPADRRATLDARAADLDDQIARLNRAYIAGAYAKLDEYLALKRDLDTQRDAVEAERVTLVDATPPDDAPALAFIETVAADYGAVLDQAPFTLRRFIVDRLDMRVALFAADGEKRVTIRSGVLEIEETLSL